MHHIAIDLLNTENKYLLVWVRVADDCFSVWCIQIDLLEQFSIQIPYKNVLKGRGRLNIPLVFF
jgi:hypothetical protein